jgi:ribonucleoside-diphosphate reductase alpha chain
MKERWHWDGDFSSLCMLVANAVGAAEPESKRMDYQGAFYELLVDGLFSPNTPTWINAGRDIKGSLSACFVYNIEDTMVSILDSSRWMGMVQKFGGGTGFDLSQLRARGVKIKSTHGKACGPIAVLKYLAATSQMVTQGGVRDGANMAVLSVYHPDVIDFIKLKGRESKFMLEIPREYAQSKIDKGEWTIAEGEDYIEYCRLNGLYQLFNVSIAVDRQFMDSVMSCANLLALGKKLDPFQDWKLPCGKTVMETWEIIVQQAWASGDPGILFMDRAKEMGLAHSPLEIRATNPCGEQFLPHNGSCNLGSINLAKFVLSNTSSGEVGIDWDDFKRVIHLSVRFLDNVVEINHHADPGIDEVNRNERRIGLGIMGWADMLFALRIPYASEEAIDVLHKVGEFFRQEAHHASVDLAVEKGAFPLWEQSRKANADSGNMMPVRSRRNATVTTIAPTGTISIAAGCSSGIEPHFLMAYEHKGLKESGGLGLIWASDTLKEFCDKPGDFSGGSWLDFYEESIRGMGWEPANEIPIEWHIQHQSIWQEYIDNSISKTLNLPNSATKEQISKAYLLAYTSGCKGSTVYRDGCKPFQPLNAPQDSKKLRSESMLKDLGQSLGEAAVKHGAILTGPVEVEVTHVLSHVPPTKAKRPRWVTSETAKIETAEGDLYITITKDDRGMPFEIFAGLGKSGTSTSAGVEALCRTISLGLRYGIQPVEYVRQLRGIKSIQHGMGPSAIFSIPDAIGQMLEEYMVRTFGEEWAAEDGWTSQAREAEPAHAVPAEPLPKTQISEACPKCGAQLYMVEGCHGGTCFACGYSKCG